MGVVAGVNEICWANKSMGEHLNLKYGLLLELLLDK